MGDLLTQVFVFGETNIFLSLTPASLALDKMTSVVWARRREGELSKRGVASEVRGALTKDQEPSMPDSSTGMPG